MSACEPQEKLKKVPKNFTRIYQVVWNKIADAPQESHQDGRQDGQDDEVVEVAVPEKHYELVKVSDTEDEDLLDKRELFDSDNKGLKDLLKTEGNTGKSETSQRRRRKTADASIPKLELGMDLGDLTKTQETEINPDTFKNVNKQLKDKNGKGKKRGKKASIKKAMKKAMKKMKVTKTAMKKLNKKAKGTQKDVENHDIDGKGAKRIKQVCADLPKMSPMQTKSWAAFVKREHSKAYVEGRKKAISEDASEAEWKAAASKAGCARADALRQALKAGKINWEGKEAEDVN